jgi:DNA-binding beta-propeller fold protein YncE
MSVSLIRRARAVAAACGVAGVVSAQSAADQAGAARRTVQQGMTIDLEVSPYGAGAPKDRVLREGDTFDIGFTIRDEGSGNPIPSLNPAAWLARAGGGDGQPAATCADLVRGALGQSFVSRPELDLNAYYVLALNADATITVVDPLFGFGGTKLLALIALESPGEDWALTPDQNRLFVSMSAAGRVAAIDTRGWSVTTNVDIGGSPTRVALQPDAAYAWVGYTAAAGGGSSGVAVIDARTLRVAARIATGRGPHNLAFSDDSRFAFVANGDAGTVSIVDIRSLRKVKDVPLGGAASSIAWSRQARAVYATSGDGGSITVISPSSPDVLARIPAAPGIGAIEFAPDGRLGFAVNPRANTVSIVDAATNRIVRTADLEKGPDQLAFSSRFAYVRHRDSEIVVMMPLDALAGEGAPLSLLDFPGGQHPFGSSSRATLAPSIVRSADDNAVLVANPADKAIYYYQEGMAAPMGQFSNYGREPVAVSIVDRSLRETQPGRYRSAARLPPAGDYRALLFINSPRVVHCFDLSIAPSARPATTETLSTQVEPLAHQPSVPSGTALRLALRMTDAGTGRPISNARDAGLLVVAPGVWQTRQSLEHEGDGVYALTIVPPAAGRYEVFVACPSRQMPFRRVATFEAAEGSK